MEAVLDLTAVAVAVLASVVVGLTVARVLSRQHTASVQALTDRLAERADASLRLSTLSGAHDLDAKKGLIDQQLAAMSAELRRVTAMVRELETGRAEQYGRLAAQLRSAGEQTARLSETTRQLGAVLGSTPARGQWGERLAEDVLRLAGFVEDVSYRRQTAMPGRRAVPDFTFLLPQDRLLHMDVKFPMSAYLRLLEAPTAAERERCRREFLRDVRRRIEEVSSRDYLDPDTTVDCVLLFIPNEQVYAWIQQHGAGLLDEALRAKVVCCSPLTLFAVLAVVRQSLDTFTVHRRADEVLCLLAGFQREWERFSETVGKLGTHLDRAQRTYDELTTTRTRRLERPLEALEALRQERDRTSEPSEPLRAVDG